MKTPSLILAAALLGSLPILGHAELVQNSDFDSGGANWSTWAGGAYFYAVSSDTIASIGWSDGNSIWQDTGAAILPGETYTLSVRARTGDGALEGLNLSFQDVTAGWVRVAQQDFWFPAADQGQNPGPWHTYSLELTPSMLAGRDGHNIGVGVELRDTTAWGQFGWLHLDNVQLNSVPEPATIVTNGVLLLAGGLWVLRRRRA